MRKEELQKKILKLEKELRSSKANIIRDLRKNHPKGFCYICGSKNEVTIHHMRDIHSRKNKKRPKVKGLISLCRDCHDIVEDIVNKGKSKRIWYHQGYQQGLKDAHFSDEN